MKENDKMPLHNMSLVRSVSRASDFKAGFLNTHNYLIVMGFSLIIISRFKL